MPGIKEMKKQLQLLKREPQHLRSFRLLCHGSQRLPCLISSPENKMVNAFESPKEMPSWARII